jgi:hypothetical protein
MNAELAVAVRHFTVPPWGVIYTLATGSDKAMPFSWNPIF